jgi:hypothetical protein
MKVENVAKNSSSFKFFILIKFEYNLILNMKSFEDILQNKNYSLYKKI